ncbi:citrate synthase [Spirochaetia bacterium]|nr:citrate synthase [Spirochaetia bacterium]
MKLIKDYIDELKNDDNIDPALYVKYNVKRGLRNLDGSGVLVGLTRVGEVHGYVLNEGEKQSVEGKLFYRGFDVEDIVKNAAADGRYGFEESVFLLLFGRQPGKQELDSFTELISSYRELPKGFVEDSIMKMPSRDIMNQLAQSVLTLYSYDETPDDLSPENVLRQCLELIARFPSIAAYSYRTKRHYFDGNSLVLHKIDSEQATAESILSLMRHDQQFTRLEAETLDLALTLHAEHGGGNNSTFSVHLVSSTDTDTYSAISAGLASLKGFKHGGANAKVMGMMEDIKANVRHWDSEAELSDYLVKLAKGEAYDHTGLIYGLGHAVYTLSDPRAVLLSAKAEILAQEKKYYDEYHLYKLIEKIGPEIIKNVKGISKDICANVDLYSGFVYKMLDIPPELYTPLFAVSRVAGWCAHRLEEVISGGRIVRPAYKCVQPHQKYVPLNERV